MGKLPKYVKVTRDGSVSNNHCDGLEIVTPPRSLDKLEEMVGDSCGVLRKGGFGVFYSDQQSKIGKDAGR